MPMRVTVHCYGIDVAKDWLDLHQAQTAERQRIRNDPAAIGAWLGSLTCPVKLAVEATNTYHEALVDQAVAAGHRVYLVDALRLAHYRQAVGVRAKTDRQDAALLARYLCHEEARLRPLRRQDPRQLALWRGLKHRACVVRAATQIRQSLGDRLGRSGRCDAGQALLAQCQRYLDQLERRLLAEARALGWAADIARCRAVPGIGPLTALGLVAAYHRGAFAHHDPFIAFLGLDVRVRDSGRHRGRRKLTKAGEPEIRRLLHNAAMAAIRRPSPFTAYYHQLRGRLSAIQALVALARKLAKVAFNLIRKQASFDPNRVSMACQSP
jgi:transposase